MARARGLTVCAEGKGRKEDESEQKTRKIHEVCEKQRRGFYTVVRRAQKYLSAVWGGRLLYAAFEDGL